MNEMMKAKNIVILFLISLMSCAEDPTQFADVVLNDSMVNLDANKIQFKDILKKHEGKQIVLNVWASWCRDCIVGMPDLKALQSDFPDADFVFLSVDRNEVIWKRSIKRYNLKGDHYFIPDGQKGVFGDFLNSNWIPRYMVLGQEGHIKLFKAKKATDTNIRNTLL